jgi:hypothetical protein
MRRLPGAFLEMALLQWHLREKGRRTSCTHTGSTPRQKPSVCNRISLFLDAHNVHCRAKIVCWIAESCWPFKIVKDHGFLSLMKTGHPGYYIPSPSTVSQDTQQVFAWMRVRIAKMLQVILNSTWRSQLPEFKM